MTPNLTPYELSRAVDRAQRDGVSLEEGYLTWLGEQQGPARSAQEREVDGLVRFARANNIRDGDEAVRRYKAAKRATGRDVIPSEGEGPPDYRHDDDQAGDNGPDQVPDMGKRVGAMTVGELFSLWSQTAPMKFVEELMAHADGLTGAGDEFGDMGEFGGGGHGGMGPNMSEVAPHLPGMAGARAGFEGSPRRYDEFDDEDGGY
jgi:hypothetical protein